MANNEFLDALSPEAEKRLKSYHSEVMKLITDIGKVNTMQIGVKPPSGTDSAIKKLTDDVAKQEVAIKKMQTTYTEVAVAAKKSADDQNAAAKITLSALEQETKARQALDKQRQSAFQSEAVRQAKEDAAILKALAIEDKATQKKIANSKKVEAQKEKEWAKFQSDFAKYEAALEKEGNAYNKVQAKVNALMPAYNNLAIKRELGVKLSANEAKQLDFLTGKLNFYQNTLKKVDATVGKHQREVGNYAKANSNLSNSIGQISRELPNFGQSFSIGILSLTNNIGALIDGIKQVKAGNASLKAEGKQTTSVLSQVLSSVLSWQTALFVGIGIFSAYSREIGDWVSELFKGKEALNELSTAQDQFNKDRLKSSARTQQNVEELKDYIKIAKNASGAFSEEQQIVAFQKLREAGKRYFKDLKDSEVFTAKGKQAIEDFTKAIEAQAKAQDLLNANRGTKERISELQAEIDAREKFASEDRRLFDLINKNKTNPQLVEQLEKEREVLNSIEDKRKDLRDELEDETLSRERTVEIQEQLNILIDEEFIQRKRLSKARAEALILEGKLDKENRDKKGRTYDPEGAILDARLRYLKELADKTQEEYNTEKQLRERQIEDIKDVATDEKKLFETRLKAYGDYLQKKTDLINDGREFELAQLNKELGIEQEQSEKAKIASLKKAGNNAKAISAINIFYQEEAIKRYEAYDAKVAAINEKSSQEQIALVDETAKAEILIKEKQRELLLINDKMIRDSAIKTYKDIIDEEKNALSVRQASFEAMLALQRKQLDLDKIRELSSASGDEYDNIILKYKQLNAELDAMATKGSPVAKAVETAKDALQELSKTITDSFLSEAGLGSFGQFFDGTFSKIMEGFDNITDASESTAKKLAYGFLVITEAAREMYNLLNKASQENFEQERTNSERKYKIDLLFAGENEAAKKELQLQAEERTRRINKREAKANKELAKFNIGVSAAQGIVGAFKDGNVIKGAIFAALIAGVAALQISALNAQSIPEYFKGTDNAPGGLAWTQEKGREIITDKSGRIKSTGSDKGAQLTTLAKGDKVYTAEQTRQLMFDNGLNGIMSTNQILPPKNNDFPIDELRAIGDRMEAAAGRVANITLQTNNDSLGNIISVVANGTASANARKTLTPQKFQR